MSNNYFKTPYLALLYSIIAQGAALIIGIFLRELNIPTFFYLGAHALSAFFIARLFKLSITWQVMNGLLPLCIPLVLQYAPPSTVKFGAFFLLLLFVPTFYTKVPYYPSNNKIFQAVLENLPKNQESFSFLDAGCGSGRLLCYLAKRHPNSTFVGVEINPLAFLVAKLISLPRRNVTIKFQDLWKLDFSTYDIVYAFLAPPLMVDIFQKVKSEMKPGALFISNTFPAPAKENKRIQISGTRQTDLYIY